MADAVQKIDPKILVANAESLLSTEEPQALDEQLGELSVNRGELMKFCAADDEFQSCRDDIRADLVNKAFRIWGEDVAEEDINPLYKMLRRLLPTLAEIAINARLVGYCVGEYIYRYDDESKRYLIDRVINKIGDLDKYYPSHKGLIYKGDTELILDDRLKYVLALSHPDSKNTKGDPLATRVYHAVKLRRQILPYAFQFMTRHAQPFAIHKGAGVVSEDDKRANVNRLRQLIAGGGAITINEGDDIQLVKLDSNGDAFRLLEQLANGRVQKVLLGRVKTSELHNGSRSAQEVDEGTRQNRMDAYGALLLQAAQHAIDATLAVNAAYGAEIKAPAGLWFEFEKTQEIDKTRAERDAILAQMGVKFNAQYFADMYSLETGHFTVEAPAGGEKQMSLKLAEGSLAYDHFLKRLEHEQFFSPEDIGALAEGLNQQFSRGRGEADDIGGPNG